MTDPLDPGQLLRMARDTVSNPREGAAAILRLHLPMRALWLSFALVIVLSMLLGEATLVLMGQPQMGNMPDQMMLGPVTMGLLQAGFLVMIAHAMAYVGRLFSGTGRFEGALALVVWLQFIFLLVQVVQIVAMLIVPPVAGLITILAMGLFFWLLVNFIAALHGFQSLGMIFVMTILSAFAIIFGLGLVLTVLGLSFGTM